uniref:LptF/LptG family permease n=1 Tax=uncultured Flavobacterium sp. TaxID=165435 RepID=UPI0025F3A589
EQIAQTNNMLNLSELNYTLDSLENNYSREAKNVAQNITQRSNSLMTTHKLIAKIPGQDTIAPVKKDSIPAKLLDLMPSKEDKARILDIMASNIKSTESVMISGKDGLFERIKAINSHWLAFYDKFVIAYACLLMFFIGAPLGAIIRKGGLGLPIVFAVLIFITFHFINTFGKKLAQENGITPMLGSWISSVVLTPLALFLTYRATNDMNVTINWDPLVVPAQKVFNKVFKFKSKNA